MQSKQTRNEKPILFGKFQVSRYLWRGSVDFKKNLDHLSSSFFKLKNGDFKDQDFSLLIERVLTGVGRVNLCTTRFFVFNLINNHTLYFKHFWLTTQPLEALRDTALFVFIVDSKCLPALTSQKSTTPLPLPIVRMLPWNETERILLWPFRDVIFFTAWNSM